jgi:hypothetical protein
MTRTLTVLPWYVVHNRDGHLIVGRRANSLYVASSSYILLVRHILDELLLVSRII